MDFYKSLWLKRKAQREAENAKNEAAHALTALSAAFTSSPKLAPTAPPSGSVSPVVGGVLTPNSPATAVVSNPLALLATTLPMIVSPVPIQQVTGSASAPSVSGNDYLIPGILIDKTMADKLVYIPMKIHKITLSVHNN